MSETVERASQILASFAEPMSYQRLNSMCIGDMVTLIHNGCITTHRIQSVDTALLTLTLGDVERGVANPRITYSGEIHDAAWNGDEWWRERSDT